MNRLVGIVVTGIWLVAMAGLVRRDILPYWTAQETPRGLPGSGDYQIGIWNGGGKRVGTTWVTARGGSEPTVQSTTEFEIDALSAILPGIKTFVLDSNLTYGPDGSLEGFKFALHGAQVPIQVTGERYVRDFACTARVGQVTKTIPLDAGVSQALGESMRPFTHLKDLHVGQSWRIRLVDPLTLLRGESMEFQMEVAKVTARETIRHAGKELECFRIETPSATAWAADDGRVIRQEVTLPILGKWVLEDEVFDARARQLARARARRTEDGIFEGRDEPSMTAIISDD